MRPAFSILLLIPFALTSQTACVKPPPPVSVVHMGEKVQAGPLVYTVLEADWRAQLGEGAQIRSPSHRFLIIHLSVTNGGSETLSIPVLKLIDDTGHAYDESMDGQAVQSWLGLIRKLKPVDTMEGNILFDVEPKSYKLKLDDDANQGSLAMVELPLRFGLERPQMPSALDGPVR
jgi:hypothetical protein